MTPCSQRINGFYIYNKVANTDACSQYEASIGTYDGTSNFSPACADIVRVPSSSSWGSNDMQLIDWINTTDQRMPARERDEYLEPRGLRRSSHLPRRALPFVFSLCQILMNRIESQTNSVIALNQCQNPAVLPAASIPSLSSAVSPFHFSFLPLPR